MRIGLVGDHDGSVQAHRDIPVALGRAGQAAGVAVSFEWVPTVEIDSAARLSGHDGLWCVPATPYRSTEGALLAIRHAREKGIPFLGTCGGFQHAILEYARNVLRWRDAEHAELAPQASRAVIAPLTCALVEVTGLVRFSPGSRIAAAYRREIANEGYHCRFGVNPGFRSSLLAGPLRVTAVDEEGDVRAVELDGHPFFVGTLFQPERAASRGEDAPLVRAFVEACASSRAGSFRQPQPSL